MKRRAGSPRGPLLSLRNWLKGRALPMVLASIREEIPPPGGASFRAPFGVDRPGSGAILRLYLRSPRMAGRRSSWSDAAPTARRRFHAFRLDFRPRCAKLLQPGDAVSHDRGELFGRRAGGTNTDEPPVPGPFGVRSGHLTRGAVFGSNVQRFSLDQRGTRRWEGGTVMIERKRRSFEFGAKPRGHPCGLGATDGSAFRVGFLSER